MPRAFIEVWCHSPTLGAFRRLGNGDGQNVIHCERKTWSAAWRAVKRGDFARPYPTTYKLILENGDMLACVYLPASAQP